MAQRDRQSGGLTWRVLSAWSDMRGSMAWLQARRPSETALLVFLLIAGLFLMLLVLAERVLGPAHEIPDANTMGALLVTGLVVFGLVLPLVLYLLAFLAHLLARVLGGTGSGHASRAAMAWAALVSAPVMLLTSVAGLLLAPALPAVATDVIRSLGLPAFAYALVQCLAQAHGFSRPWPVLAIAAGLVALAVAGLRLFAPD